MPALTYPHSTLTVTIGGRTVAGTREDLFAAIVEAITRTADDLRPMVCPSPDPEVVRRAADMVVESMAPPAGQRVLFVPLGPTPVWARLRRGGSPYRAP